MDKKTWPAPFFKSFHLVSDRFSRLKTSAVNQWTRLLYQGVTLGARYLSNKQPEWMDPLTRRTQEALREERDRAQRYLDIAGVMLIAIDRNGRVTLVNKKGCEILGYDESEIIGKRWFENFLPKKDRDQTRAVFSELID